MNRSPLKRGLAIATAVLLSAFLVGILARSFGSDPHRVPFMLAGKPAPEFTLTSLRDGSPVRSADFKGKPLVLNFWATWCAPCLAEHPILSWAERTYGDRVAFVGIVFEDSEANARAFLLEHASRYVQLADSKSTVAVDYGVSGVPETYFVDKHGIIVSKRAGPFASVSEFTSEVSSILP